MTVNSHPWAERALSVLGIPFRWALTVRILNALSRRILKTAVPLGRYLTKRRLSKCKPRSFWGVTPIITLPLKAQADERLGIRSESVVWTTYVITQNFSWNLRVPAAIVHRINPELLSALGRLMLAMALLRYDIFHYFNDRGLLWPNRNLGLEPEELDVLKQAGKATYVLVYGADIRTRETTMALGRWNFCTDCPEPGRYCICDEGRGRSQMAQTASRVNAVIAMGDMIAYAPQAHNIHYWPIDLSQIKPSSQPAKTTGPLVIAHAPNHMHFKGTVYLEAAIAALQNEGEAIALSRVSGVPNTEVMRLFDEADIVADQFIGGAYGFTALEAMARGKPVLCYIRNLDMVMAANECPILQTRPETLVEVLRWCLANREKLGAIGEQGRRYVEKHHCINAVAGRFAALYAQTGVFPASLVSSWSAFKSNEKIRQSHIPVRSDWQHPFVVTAA